MTWVIAANLILGYLYSGAPFRLKRRSGRHRRGALRVGAAGLLGRVHRGRRRSGRGRAAHPDHVRDGRDLLDDARRHPGQGPVRHRGGRRRRAAHHRGDLGRAGGREGHVSRRAASGELVLGGQCGAFGAARRDRGWSCSPERWRSPWSGRTADRRRRPAAAAQALPGLHGDAIRGSHYCLSSNIGKDMLLL